MSVMVRGESSSLRIQRQQDGRAAQAVVAGLEKSNMSESSRRYSEGAAKECGF